MDKARKYFKGKKVTVLGLGLLGKGLGDTVFLAKCGAEVTVTDLKTAKELAPSVAALKKYKNARFVLGRHDLADFEHADMILKAQGTPTDSLYIAHARAHGIPIRMDDELFVTLAPKNIKVIGVTGTRGKTTTASLIFHLLKKAGKRVHLGGNIRGVATLALLPKIKSGDYVVLELSSWQLQGFGEQKMSPHVSVFTNFMPDHMNYYNFNLKEYFADKANCFKYQKSGDYLVATKNIAKKIPKNHQGKLLVTEAADIPKNWKLSIPGEHNRQNVVLAIAAARALKIPLAAIRRGVESFKAVEGRLQHLRTVRGVAIYNDNNSTTPQAATAALKSFPDKNIILIAGGADKGIDVADFVQAMKKHAKAVILLPGSGTSKLKARDLEAKTFEAATLRQALTEAMHVAKAGEILLFSPGLASFGLFKNEYDRNDQFVALVKKLK